MKPDQIDSGIQHLSLFHFTMLSSMRGEVLFVAVVMIEVVFFPRLVGGAWSSSKLSLKTGATLQNNQNNSALNSTGPSLVALNAPLTPTLAVGLRFDAPSQ